MRYHVVSEPSGRTSSTHSLYEALDYLRDRARIALCGPPRELPQRVALYQQPEASEGARQRIAVLKFDPVGQAAPDEPDQSRTLVSTLHPVDRRLLNDRTR